MAEFRFGLIIRINLGILSIFGVFVIASVRVPGSGQHFHRVALRELGELAAESDLQRMQQALSTYNNTAGINGSTDIAARKMWEVISQESKTPRKP